MHSRPLEEYPEKIVHNGKIHFGSFQGVSDRLDVRGVRAPFAGIPTSRFFSNFRIKSKLTYVFCFDEFAGLVEFFDDKAFGLAEVSVWNRETNQKYSYHTFMGPRRRFVPVDTSEAAVTSYSKKRYVKISWSRRFSKMKLSFTLKGDGVRPAMKGKFRSPFVKDRSAEILFVNPAPTTQRCSATWFVPFEFTGGIATAKQRKQIDSVPENKGLGLVCLNRTYLKVHTSASTLFGLFEDAGRKIFFSFSSTSQDALDDDTYNNNFLQTDGKTTALPSVKITHPFGIGGNWIIQDTESMVDLTFTPLSVSHRTVNIIIMRNANSTIYGTFEGILLTKDGEKIPLKNCPGIIKKSTLRL